MPCPGSRNKLVVQQGIRCCFPESCFSAIDITLSSSQELLRGSKMKMICLLLKPMVSFSLFWTLVELANFFALGGLWGFFNHFPENRLSRDRLSPMTSHETLSIQRQPLNKTPCVFPNVI